MHITLKIWRQSGPDTKGTFETHEVEADQDMSFLEMLDVLNEDLISQKKEPVAFEHDCREGICGSCDLMINGQPHGPLKGTTACQLHMRHFKNGDTITVEPWRAKAFPVIKDLVVDRSAFDRVIEAGGYISVSTGQAQDGNNIPVNRYDAFEAFDSATCIGCGACVAACPNSSAALFVGAKVSHLGIMPQGKVEKMRRVKNMVAQMDKEGFGFCSNTGACSAECPKEIGQQNIARLNKWYRQSLVSSDEPLD